MLSETMERFSGIEFELRLIFILFQITTLRLGYFLINLNPIGLGWARGICTIGIVIKIFGFSPLHV